MAQTLLEEQPAPIPADVAPARAPVDGGRWAERAAVGASLITSAAFIFRSRFTLNGKAAFALFDDAMISLTYGRNLARGSGLVWNEGGERVEGYTNFLWTLWMAAIHAVGVPERLTSLAVMVTGALLLAGTVVLTIRIARRAALPDPAAVIAAWMVALSPPLIFWTLRGMEVGLLAGLLAAAVLLTFQIAEEATNRRLVALALVMAAGALTRTDFVVLALVVAGFATWWCDPAHRRRVIASTFGALGATVVAHTVFRLAYYGAATPNTFALKIGGVGLVDRIDRGVTVVVDIVGIELLVPLLIVGLGFVVDRRAPSRLEQLAGVLILASFGYVAYTGADAWEWMTMPDRYVAPVLPQLALLVGVAAVKLARARALPRSRVAVAIGASIVLLMLAVATPATDAGRQLASGTFLRIATLATLAGLVALGVALLARPGTRRHLAAVVGAIAVLSVFAMPAYQWVRINAPYLDGDQHNARWGAAIADLTSRDATIAVVSAGAITYFSDRPAVDLLGKSDVAIAAGDPQPVPFVPGHVKWNYDWSLGELRPDLVTAYYGNSRDARATLRRYGYERVRGRVYVRSGTPDVDVERLAAHLAREPAEMVPASSR